MSIKEGIMGKRQSQRISPKKKTVQMIELPLPQPKNDMSKQLVVLAVALAMMISVVGTFVVLNELATMERSIDSLQAHTALNAMLVRQQQEAEILRGVKGSGEVSVHIKPIPPVLNE